MAEKVNIKQAFEDVVSLDISLPVSARLRKRYREIKKLGSATNVTVPFGNKKKHKTFGPEMHIQNLEAGMYNGVGIITYNVFKTDSHGNKVINKQNMISPVTGKEVEVNGDYIIEKTVKETIEYLKPIKMEEFKNES